ncbi:MAG: septum formation initiator family protein [Gammaproteobacteria bacterium]
MKIIVSLAFAVVVSLQYQLWFATGGLIDSYHLTQAIKKQREINQTRWLENRALEAEVADLKAGSQAIEEQARNELGMIHAGEVFYQII